MVQHMDGPTSVCFALTSHRHYDIVADRIGPHFTIFKFKTLRPFCMEIWVHRLGEEEHEKFIRQLWTWLGGRCVYCGITKELCKQDSGGASFHVCAGWIQPCADHELAMFTTEFEKERLKASVDILSGLTGLDGYCGRSVGRRIQDIRREVETSVRLIPDPASLGI